MNLSIEVLKNKQNKFIFCRIEVDVRPVFYFYKQKRAHRTHRWISTEQWAAYDAKVQELLSKNELNHLKNPLTCNLEGSLRLILKDSQVSKSAIYNSLNNKDISLEDVVNVIDCKITYQDHASNGTMSSTQIKLAAYEKTAKKEITPQSLTSCDSNGFREDVDGYEIPGSENSIYTPKQFCTQESEKLPFTQSEQQDDLNVESSDKLAIASPIFQFNNINLSPAKSCDKQIEESSTESSDVAKEFLSKSIKTNEEIFEYNKENKPHEKKHVDDKLNSSNEITDNDSPKDITKEPASKNFNENEENDLVIHSSPSEKLKRKLQRSDEKNCNRIEQKECISPRQKQFKTEINGLDESKTPRKELTISRSHSSGSKKKKNKRERSKSPCSQEKHAMNKWLTKKSSKDEEKTSKHFKSSKHSSTSRKNHSRAGSSGSQKQRFTTEKILKPLEAILSNEEELKLIKEKEIIVENERKLIKNIKELLPKDPIKVTILDLLNVPEKEMLATYEEHRDELETIFNEQKSQKTFNCIDGVNHYLVINLVTMKVQQKLMEKLSEFEKNNIPKYGNLFSMVLMPEWILRVFMSKFKMSRSEAIQHIEAQNRYNALKEFPCKELDQLNLKK